MLSDFLSKANELFTTPVRLGLMVLMFFGGLYIFWSAVRREYLFGTDSEGEHKRFRSSKVFDLAFLGMIVAVITARFFYIIYSPSEFRGMRWFWLPYEKIEGNVFLFSSLPWLFLKFTDGRLLYIGFTFGFVLFCFFFTRVFELELRKITRGVANVLWLFYTSFSFYYSFVSNSEFHFIVGVSLLLVGLICWLCELVKTDFTDKLRGYLRDLVWNVLNFLIVPLVFIVYTIFDEGIVNKPFLIITQITQLVLTLWIFWVDLVRMDLPFLKRLKGIAQQGSVQTSKQQGFSPAAKRVIRRDVKNDLSQEKVNADSIPTKKLSDSSIDKDEIVKQNTGAKSVLNERHAPSRSFSMSYKDFSNDVSSKMGGIKKLFQKKRSPVDEEKKQNE